MAKSRALPTFYFIALTGNMIGGVANVAAACLSRIVNATVIGTEADGVGDFKRGSIGLSFYLNLVFANAIPNSKIV